MSTFNKNPGPGKYESIPGLNEKGKFPISKFKSYGVAIINPMPNNSVKTLNGIYYLLNIFSFIHLFTYLLNYLIINFNINVVPGPGTYE